ncbi:hypothetical protein [Ferrimonas lipolytica]|uniref:Uncharacterized protein n=1 Tax=Ferrimonas lipolytica TaxID=2724191 RepID=A0A6H1UFH6_9GAMM|nr:hypothetical protein [Ferrimonas lipolytica]QIZ77578.1 hypothetical protein HER31_12150 [Ferrimonas lipolytica]
MNLDKSRKRIDKKVKMGFKGYPQIMLTYRGKTEDCATEVVIGFIAAEGTAVQEQTFASQSDVRLDETIQSTLVKIIERADAKTVTEQKQVELIS